MRIFCDFDGTISREDTTDLILGRFAGPAWEDIEAEWTAGAIDAAECMTRQVRLIRAGLPAIEAALDEVMLRDGFVSFLDWARRHGHPFGIVSDGIDHFIRHVLARHGIGNVPLFANRLVADGPDRWRLEQPWRARGCTGGSGVCKCNVVDAFAGDRPFVFIGDGRSDFCVATKPDILFATSGLERFCTSQAIAHQPFSGFAEIRDALERLAAPARKLAVFA